MMIGGQTVMGYITQVVVLGQPLVFMWLHESKIRVPDVVKYYFYLIGFQFILLIATTGFEIGFYTSSLLIQYAFLTMGATVFYNQRNPIKEAVCLGFLTVFLTSFYWEIPLHLAEIFSGAPHIGMLVQLWRLLPAVWFLKNYTFDNRSKKTLAKGLLFSLVLNVVAYLYLTPKLLTHAIIRWGCLLFLVKTIVEAKPKEEVMNIGS